MENQRASKKRLEDDNVADFLHLLGLHKCGHKLVEALALQKCVDVRKGDDGWRWEGAECFRVFDEVVHVLGKVLQKQLLAPG